MQFSVLRVHWGKKDCCFPWFGLVDALHRREVGISRGKYIMFRQSLLLGNYYWKYRFALVREESYGQFCPNTT